MEMTRICPENEKETEARVVKLGNSFPDLLGDGRLLQPAVKVRNYD